MVTVVIVMLSVFGDMTLCAEILPELESGVKLGLISEKEAEAISDRCERYVRTTEESK